MTNGDQYNRNHFVDLAMITVFDIAGPLVAYSLLRSAGQSAVTALVLSGAFQAKMWWGIVGATGVIWSACYLLWMYQRVFFGQVKHEVNNSLPDLNLREKTALWPAVVMALAMGVAPMLWLNGIDPAVKNVLSPNPEKNISMADKNVRPTQTLVKVVGQ